MAYKNLPKKRSKVHVHASSVLQVSECLQASPMLQLRSQLKGAHGADCVCVVIDPPVPKSKNLSLLPNLILNHNPKS